MEVTSQNEIFLNLSQWMHGVNDKTTEHPLQPVIEKQYYLNHWITPELSYLAIQNALKLLQSFSKLQVINLPAKNVGVLPFKNIPLAGFFECMYLLSLNQVIWLKKDDTHNLVLQEILTKLSTFSSKLNEQIHIVDTFPKSIEKWLIFKNHIDENPTLTRYFQLKPTLVLPKTISVYKINGRETNDELIRLGERIFLFWGFRPENVRKLMVPKGYSFNRFFEIMEQFATVYSHNKYANNYDYHKSVFLMDRKPFLDNGFVVLYETPEYEIPIGCLGYEYYPPESAENIIDVASSGLFIENSNTLQSWEICDSYVTLISPRIFTFLTNSQ